MKKIKENEVMNNRFYQLPKFLFNDKYIKISNDAKVLYALLRDRHDLSIKNKWKDEKGNVFLLFSQNNMADMLGRSRRTVRKLLDELLENNLMLEERQGLNKPNRIYILEEKSSENQEKQGSKPVDNGMGKIYPSGWAESTHQDGQSLPTNDTDFNDTEKNNIYRLIFKEYLVHEIIEHKQITDSIKESVDMALDSFTLEEITKAIATYGKAFNSNFYFNYKYPLQKLLEKDNIINWLPEGAMYENYMQHLESESPKESKGNSWKVDAT